MAENLGGKSKGKPVAVVVGATSKWQSDGRNTKLAHGRAVDDSNLPVGIVRSGKESNQNATA